MRNHRNIRNMSVIAHVDHGKTTLTDSLLHRAGLLSEHQTGTKRATDIGKQEEERGITINSTGISLHYSLPDGKLPKDANGNEFLINLIDSPGHVDFSSEVTAALRVTDGALVVVDAVEGACVQTETVLRQALIERIRPVLMVNKLDRYLFEKQYEPQEYYRQVKKVIEQINVIISTYQNEKLMGDLQLHPDAGTVAFGSGYYKWGFTLYNVAEFWSKRVNKPVEELVKKMWESEAAFVKYVADPLVKLKQMVDAKDYAKVWKFADNIGIKLSTADKELTEKKLVNCILSKWYPASDALLEMIVEKLPSPDVAQAYRTETLYSGPKDDFIAEAMRKCDPNGPLMVYISKMVPDKDKNKFYAFGRVFSGTIRGGQTVHFYGMDYEYGKEHDFHKNIRPANVYVMMANKMDALPDCPAGNTLCLSGVDQYILKNGTISDQIGIHPFHAMKFSVSPVVRVAVAVKNPADLPKFDKALKKISKADPLCKVSMDPKTGEMIIAGAGELHIDVILNDLRDEYCKGLPFTISEPVVPFRETVQSKSEICLAKSPNNHNRLWMTAEPLSEELVRDIESKELNMKQDKQLLCKELIEKYNWDPNDANPKRLWAFGPELDFTNVIIDATTGVQYMNEIRDNIVAAFMNMCYEGFLCDEPLRGVMFKIVDCTLHADNIHRGGGQIIPAARRAMTACQYTGRPCLTEPIFALDITAPDSVVGSIYGVVSQRRGQITEQTSDDGTPICKLKGTIPVMESFGFDGVLRSETSGQAFQQCSFSHWALMAGELTEPDGRLMTVVTSVRKRKGLKEELPPLEEFRDKL